SFLESTAPLDTPRLRKLAESDPAAARWLEQDWLAGRAGRGRLLREYIEATWTEFDWNSAYQEFRDAYLARGATHVGPQGLALELGARCATETALAVFYRTLAKSADEPALRALMGAAAQEHAGYFDYFRGLFERSRARRITSLAAGFRAVLASCRAARE